MFTQHLEQVGGPSASLSQVALGERGPGEAVRGEAGRGEQSPPGSVSDQLGRLLLEVEKEAFL